MENFFKSLLSVFLILLLCPLVSFPQEKVIKGVVISSDSIPLIRAEVSAKSASQSVQTDSMGNFSIVVKLKDKIKIKAEGFVSKNFKIEKIEKDPVLVMEYDPGNPKNGNRLIYDGNSQYIALLNGKKVDVTGYHNIYELIQDNVSGVLVNDTEGNKEIIIRGKSTMGSSDPLVVIDGVLQNTNALDNLALPDIMSVDILKDGSASRYGSKGGNGVIEIKTKRGQNY
jgi:TonB-dependent SusC/RagA subfamily outer membrane receptor